MSALIRGTSATGLGPAGDLRCPTCRAIDWRRDTYAIWVDRSTGELHRRRLRSGGHDDVAWTCRACGHTLGASLEIAHQLHLLRVTHWE